MKKIILIGGGENGGDFSIELEKQIAGLLKMENPSVLYLPFASEYDTECYDAFEDLYKDQFGCQTQRADEHHADLLKAQLKTADLIYFGRGSTLRLSEKCRSLQLEPLLLQAYQRGCILVGFSAGANYLCSSSISSEGEAGLIRVKGLGIIDAFCCTHFNYENRSQGFIDMCMPGETGIALEDHSALFIKPNQVTLFKAHEEAGHFVVTKDQDQTAHVTPMSPQFRVHML